MARCAAIDIGTNSVKLTVADGSDDGDFHIVARELHVSQLGRDAAADGTLDASAMERTIGAVKALVACAGELRSGAMRIVATEALRAAPNGAQFIRDVLKCCDLEVELLQPVEEASLSWSALCAEQQIGSGASVMLDVGGGSTECLFASGVAIDDVVSMPLGALSMTAQFSLGDCIEEAAWSAFTEHVTGVMHTAIPRPTEAPYAWAVGGTSTAMVALDRRGVGLPAGTDVVLPTGDWAFTGLGMDRLRELVAHLRHLSLEDRIEATCLDRDRAAILPAGGYIMQALLDRLGVASGCCVTHHGVRDGVLRAMLAS
jgi:exopolyphosphatase/guanosine-5'-triphosphate,3'-diphosphate pyrophosphatase